MTRGTLEDVEACKYLGSQPSSMQCSGILHLARDRKTQVMCYDLGEAPVPGVAYVYECKSCNAQHHFSYWYCRPAPSIWAEHGAAAAFLLSSIAAGAVCVQSPISRDYALQIRAPGRLHPRHHGSRMGRCRREEPPRKHTNGRVLTAHKVERLAGAAGACDGGVLQTRSRAGGAQAGRGIATTHNSSTTSLDAGSKAPVALSWGRSC